MNLLCMIFNRPYNRFTISTYNLTIRPNNNVIHLLSWLTYMRFPLIYPNTISFVLGVLPSKPSAFFIWRNSPTCWKFINCSIWYIPNFW